jgi:hypothetical protein
VRRRLLIVLAVTILNACDAPLAGPTVPDGGHSLSLTTLATYGQGPFDNGQDIVASTSLETVRADVISLTMTQTHRTEAQLCTQDVHRDLCWRQQIDRPGRLYLAVITFYQCNADTKEAAAISGRTLYFIRWIGNAKGACNASMMLPNWRLFSASRADLPSSGTLTVRLQLQGATDRVAAETQVELT